jgi:3-isopropylmalate/(R)-2-methylmalate dehydratase large subunit
LAHLAGLCLKLTLLAGDYGMGMNIIEKILARKSGAKKISPGELVVVDVDTAVFIDNAFFPAYYRDMLKLADPEKIIVVFDHRAPASDRVSAGAHVVGRAFVKRFGIKRFHDVGANVGIAHVVVADNAYALPGTVLVCADSHTCSGGAFNCAARGVGAPDMIYAATTGKAWFKLGETVRYDLVGKLPGGGDQGRLPCTSPTPSAITSTRTSNLAAAG